MCEAVGMRDTARMPLLTGRQRPMAWIAFLVTALSSPVAAALLSDASWLFCVTVAALVATVIVIDDSARTATAPSRNE
jgi:hypothetical protein